MDFGSGTNRSLSPLPMMRRTRRARSMAMTSSVAASLMRRPQALHEGEAGPMDRVADGAKQAADLIVRQRVRQPLLPRRADPFFPQTPPRPDRACGRRRTATHTGQFG